MKAQAYMESWAAKHQKEWHDYRQFKMSGRNPELAERMRIRLLFEEDTIRNLGFTIKGNPDKGYVLGCKWDEMKESKNNE